MEVPMDAQMVGYRTIFATTKGSFGGP